MRKAIRSGRRIAPIVSDGRDSFKLFSENGLLPLNREMAAAVHLPGVLVVADHERALLADRIVLILSAVMPEMTR